MTNFSQAGSNIVSPLLSVLQSQQARDDAQAKEKARLAQQGIANTRAEEQLGFARAQEARSVDAFNRGIGKDQANQIAKEQTNIAMLNPAAARAEQTKLLNEQKAYATRLDSFDLDTPEGEALFFAEPSVDRTSELNKLAKVDWSKVRSEEKAQLALDVATPGTPAYNRALKAVSDEQARVFQEKTDLIDYKASLKEPRAISYDLFADPKGNLHNLEKGKDIPVGWTKATGKGAGGSSSKSNSAKSTQWQGIKDQAAEFGLLDTKEAFSNIEALQASGVNPDIVTDAMRKASAASWVDNTFSTKDMDEYMPKVYNNTGEGIGFGSAIEAAKKNGAVITLDNKGNYIMAMPNKPSTVDQSTITKADGSTSKTDTIVEQPDPTPSVVAKPGEVSNNLTALTTQIDNFTPKTVQEYEAKQSLIKRQSSLVLAQRLSDSIKKGGIQKMTPANKKRWEELGTGIQQGFINIMELPKNVIKGYIEFNASTREKLFGDPELTKIKYNTSHDIVNNLAPVAPSK